MLYIHISGSFSHCVRDSGVCQTSNRLCEERMRNSVHFPNLERWQSAVCNVVRGALPAGYSFVEFGATPNVNYNGKILLVMLEWIQGADENIPSREQAAAMSGRVSEALLSLVPSGWRIPVHAKPPVLVWPGG